MICYKLFRQLKDGNITSLFINKTRRLPIGEWLDAEEYPTKGFAFRPMWHCTRTPEAPHISMNNRVWYKVEVQEYEEFKRPKNQGGMWYLSKRIKILDPV